MSGRGRRVAIGLVILALLLSAGHGAATFVADRLWEASISESVAATGLQRALWALGLEITVIAVSTAWLFLHFTLAARIGLPSPDKAPPESDGPTWPREIPRWSLAVAALVVGVLLGGGAGQWLDYARLSLDGVRLGVADPLLGEDLGVFLGSFPLRVRVQEWVTILSLVALGGAVVLHLAGRTVHLTGRRIQVSSRARGQLSVLISVLALCLAWGASLEPLRLATGFHGPVWHAEFQLRSLMAYLGTGLGAAAAALSLLWWVRIRGAVAFLFWLIFGLAWIGGKLLPLHAGNVAADPSWQLAARDLDSIAFQLALAPTLPARRPPAGLIVPTLWDDSVIARRSGPVLDPARGWIAGPGGSHPVWFAVSEEAGVAPTLLALSDDQAASTGAVLAWGEAGRDEAPAPGLRPYRELSPHAIRPRAPRIDLAPGALGVRLDGWLRRIALAWALQAPGALSAPRGTRIGWRLDPAGRLRSVAPFAHWSRPRIRALPSGIVWQSDGLLGSDRFPSSSRAAWNGGMVSMARTAFLATVEAGTGAVRIFRRDPADSLAAAWARIAAPLVEPSSSIPPELRVGEAYPDELAFALARVLEGPAWNAGRLDRTGTTGLLPPESPGGGERVIPFSQPGSPAVASVLLIRRTPVGDSLRLVRLDSLAAESPSALRRRWERFPFPQALRDSATAAGATFRAGAVRFALAEEGIVAYQPAWSLDGSGPAHLVLVNLAIGWKLGTGRTYPDAWKNLRGEIIPAPVGAGAQAILEEARRWWRHADSAFKRGDLAELGRALAYLRELLERQP